MTERPFNPYVTTMSRRSSAAGGDQAAPADDQAQTHEEDLKSYLGDTLVPLLAYALDELEKIRPPDPVLFLAHFLLRHNPKKSYQ
jgi:protein dpy-30